MEALAVLSILSQSKKDELARALDYKRPRPVGVRMDGGPKETQKPIAMSDIKSLG